jgi:hypothetical protein
VAVLTHLQCKYANWRDALPDNQQDSTLADAYRPSAVST